MRVRCWIGRRRRWARRRRDRRRCAEHRGLECLWGLILGVVPSHEHGHASSGKSFRRRTSVGRVTRLGCRSREWELSAELSGMGCRAAR